MKDSIALRMVLGNKQAEKLLSDSNKVEASIHNFNIKLKQDKVFALVFVTTFVVGLTYKILNKK